MKVKVEPSGEKPSQSGRRRRGSSVRWGEGAAVWPSALDRWGGRAVLGSRCACSSWSRPWRRCVSRSLGLSVSRSLGLCLSLSPSRKLPPCISQQQPQDLFCANFPRNCRSDLCRCVSVSLLQCVCAHACVQVPDCSFWLCGRDAGNRCCASRQGQLCESGYDAFPVVAADAEVSLSLPLSLPPSLSLARALSRSDSLCVSC